MVSRGEVGAAKGREANGVGYEEGESGNVMLLAWKVGLESCAYRRNGCDGEYLEVKAVKARVALFNISAP